LADELYEDVMLSVADPQTAATAIKHAAPQARPATLAMVDDLNRPVVERLTRLHQESGLSDEEFAQRSHEVRAGLAYLHERGELDVEEFERLKRELRGGS